MQSILITVDALRADRLGQYGHYRDTMPALDRLANEGVVFTDAFSNGPYTRVSVPSIHTSTYLGYEDISERPTIASVLGEQGVRTACIGTKTGFNSVHGDLVFDEYVDLGRDDYAQEAVRDEPIRRVSRSVGPLVREYAPNRAFEKIQSIYEGFIDEFRYLGYKSAEEVTDAAINWVSEHQSEDFFLWLHYMEGHRPYGVHDQDPEYLKTSINQTDIKRLMKKAGTCPGDVTLEERELMLDLYDSDLRFCSRHLERFFDTLQEEDIWNSINILFTSDHGEEFYDHGCFYHRNLPYDELTRVPLIVKTKNLGPMRIKEQRELVDIAPTICEMHDIDLPEEFRGTPLFEGDERDVIIIGAQLKGEQVVACRKDGWKYIDAQDEVLLFNLEDDPGEHRSVAETKPDVMNGLKGTIPPEVANSKPERQHIPDDQTTRKRLEALGYVEISEDE